MAPLLTTEHHEKNIARTVDFGTDEGNLAIGLSAGVFSLIIVVTLIRWWVIYRRVQRAIRRYERRQEEQAENQARLAAEYQFMDKLRHAKIELESFEQSEEEEKANEVESRLSEVSQAQTAPLPHDAASLAQSETLEQANQLGDTVAENGNEQGEARDTRPTEHLPFQCVESGDPETMSTVNVVKDDMGGEGGYNENLGNLRAAGIRNG